MTEVNNDKTLDTAIEEDPKEFEQLRLSQLIVGISQGDEQMLAQLYDQTVDRVYGLAFSILGNRNDAEEIVCDAFTQVWKQAGHYHQKKARVLTWMMVICRSRAIDCLRKRRVELNFDEANPDVAEHHKLSSEPDYILQKLQESSEVHNLIASLEPIQREMISLAFFKGLSHQQISEVVRVPLGTVKSHIRRGLAKLHSILVMEESA